MLNMIRQQGGSWVVKIGAGLVALIFIFIGYGNEQAVGEDYAAKVDGRKIPMADFEFAYRNQQQSERMRNPNLPQELQDRFLTQRVLDGLVERELLLQFADEVGIHVSGREVADEIKRLPYLVDEKTGEFIGKEKYVEFLTMRDIPVAEFEQDIERALRVEKARDYITGAVKVTDAEVRDEYDLRNEKVTLAYLDIDPIALAESLKDRKLTDAEIDAWVKEHPGAVEAHYQEFLRTRYTTPAKVKLQQLTVRKPAPGQDEAPGDVKARAEKALAAATTDWKKAAEEFSQGAPWEKTGQPREFARRELPAAVADAAFAMEPGAPAQLVETPTSWVVLRVEGKSEEKVAELDEKLRRDIVEENIRETLAADEAKAFAEEAFRRATAGESLEKIAASKDLAVKETGAFPRRDEIPGMPGSDAALVSKAFELKAPGDVLAVDGKPVQVGDGWIVAVLKEHATPKDEEFETQKTFIRMGLERQKSQAVFDAWKADRIANAKIVQNPLLFPAASS